MAAPTISIRLNTGSEASPTWTEITSGDSIVFTGSGSSDGDLKPIPRPVGSNKVRIADELWANRGTDVECTIYDAGGQEVTDYTLDMFPSNPTVTNIIAIQADTNPESQAGELEAWDDTGYDSTTKEILAGTTNLGAHSQLRAAETASNVTTGAGAGSLAAGYQSQPADGTTYQLQGSTRKITFTTALTAGNQNRIASHLFVVDDSTAGSETVELTYKYYYT